MIKCDFKKLGSASWMHEYLHQRAKTAFEEDHAVFKSEAFLANLGSLKLNIFMMKCV
jgi:hypothetical protein